MIKHYGRLALRNIWKNKGQNLMAVMGLSVGILCFSICLYFCRFIYHIDHCFPEHERIVELKGIETTRQQLFSGTPTTLVPTFRSWQQPEAEAFCVVTYARERSYSVETAPGKHLPYRLQTLESDSAFFQVFQPKWLLGNLQALKQTPNALVVTESTATRLFQQKENALGQTLTLLQRLRTSPANTPKEGGVSYTILGVIEDIPLNSSLSFLDPIDLIAFNDSEGLLRYDKRGEMTGANSYARLSKHSTCADLQARFDTQQYTYELYHETHSIRVAPLGTQIRRELLATGNVIGIVGSLILLVSCLHFFQLLTGSFLNRKKEFSLLKLLGSTKRTLFCQLFTQTVLLLTVSVFLVCWFIELLDGRMNLALYDMQISVDTATLYQHVFQYYLLLLAGSAGLSAWFAVHIHRITVHKGLVGTPSRIGKQVGKSLMLGIQFFISWIFVALSLGLFLQSAQTYQSLFHTLSLEEKQAILSVPLDYEFLKEADKWAMIERMKQHAGVKDVLQTDIDFLKGMSGNGMLTEKGNRDSYVEVSRMVVPANFFSFMNLPIVQGTSLKESHDLVADGTWIEQHPDDAPGSIYYSCNTLDEQPYTICGICAPFCTDVYSTGYGYVFQLDAHPSYIGHVYVKPHPGQEEAVKEWVVQVQRESLPENISPRCETLLNNIHEQQVLEYHLRDIILFFAGVCLVLTLLGVYSHITIDTERRQKEVAIRKVNGAGTRQIVWLFARRYVLLLVVSAGAALPLVGILLSIWKQMYIVFFTPGLLFWLSIVGGVTGFTALTVFFRIRKIARLNPVVLIKNE